MINVFLYIAPGSIFRILLLNLIGQKISYSASVHRIKIKSLKPKTLIIGARSIINPNVLLDNRNKIVIGENVAISEFTKIYTTSHDHSSYNRPTKGSPVIIEDMAFIYSNVIVTPGVRIIKGSVIASGAVVAKSTDEEYGIYAGNPAKIKKKLSCFSFKNNFYNYLWVP